MAIPRVRGVIMLAVLGSFTAGFGCGGAEEGTTVQVDKEQEKQLTDSMESYYTKGAGKSAQ
ncbi:hypothetical protein [Tautonia plasticadhaerens]|uniref:Secreted protein n=1 Tax=Tautonia plasticadhaerens TaxID=2527974 RepID=A0A518H5P3_9BACT|nr:hypothetical protein [Tautonia plasticadhaerens]QDV36138.1 hypothetical protein ElP_40520 [Tautonia plasticadhaerens]